ncbi:MAG: hypothetical protein JWN52_2178 [Actinomycetia bacterium]|nr:hypothetical protein [Actinomycetes bacterium]
MSAVQSRPAPSRDKIISQPSPKSDQEPHSPAAGDESSAVSGLQHRGSVLVHILLAAVAGIVVTAGLADRSRVYVGDDFTTVGGKTRNHTAAFDTATGALDPAFKPSVSGKVRAISATNTTIYFGGNFFSVNGSIRTRLAARNGALSATWRPVADDGEVFALLVPPDHSRVIVGGRFQKLLVAELRSP